MATDFLKTQFGGRVYPAQYLAGLGLSLYLAKPATVSTYLRTFGQTGITAAPLNKLLNYTNPARYVSVGAAAATFIVTAGPDFPGLLGENLTITVSANSGALTISQVGCDITIQPAAGGSTAAAVVTAFNAFFTGTAAQVCTAALLPGNAGGTNVTPSQAKRQFVSDQRTP
jgi:hypothetical protein